MRGFFAALRMARVFAECGDEWNRVGSEDGADISYGREDGDG
jgi:hypothetical protein